MEMMNRMKDSSGSNYANNRKDRIVQLNAHVGIYDMG